MPKPKGSRKGGGVGERIPKRNRKHIIKVKTKKSWGSRLKETKEIRQLNTMPDPREEKLCCKDIIETIGLIWLWTAHWIIESN